MPYLSGLFSDSLQTTKRPSYNGYYIYIPSFIQFRLPCRCDKPLIFLCKNSIITLQILNRFTKIGIEMRFNKVFMCTKLQLDSSSYAFTSYGQKYKVCEMKNKKKQRTCFEILLTCISGSAGTICLKFGM